MDNISAEEIVAATKESGLKAMHNLCQLVWEHEEIPSEWKRSVIVPLHKKKDKLDCSNYRGISLLCHSGKVFSSIILQRIQKKTEEVLSKAQAGFRRNRSTIDQIFTLRQLAEKYEEFGKKLYVGYIDFKKAFDSVWRRGLWKTMRHYGYPEKIIRILENAYQDTFSAVRVDGELSDWFNTIVRVLQGCILSPLLFNIFLEVIMAMAMEDSHAGAVISGEVIGNLRFADDIAALGENEEDLQDTIKRIEKKSNKMGMRINVEKTEVQLIGKVKENLNIEVDGQQLKQTNNFVYLGGSISSNEGSETDIQRRLGITRSIFQNLNQVWISKEIGKNTKIKVYETLVLSALLYNSETWTIKETQKQRLRVFEMACLRKIEGVTRREKIRNEEIRERVGCCQEIDRRIRKRRLKYFGHVNRMPPERYPRIALYGYVHGKRNQGRPKKRWIDNIKNDCIEMNSDLYDATSQTRNREGWRKSVEKLPLRAQA